MKINPYLRFNENCREAFEFYKSCLGGELKFQTVGESPMAKDMPAETHSRIMHVDLSKGGEVLLLGSDMMRDKANFGDNISISVNTDNEADTRNIFEKLSAGGEVFMPLEKQFWGGLFGVITDKFGVEWMVNFQE